MKNLINVANIFQGILLIIRIRLLISSIIYF